MGGSIKPIDSLYLPPATPDKVDKPISNQEIAVQQFNALHPDRFARFCATIDTNGGNQIICIVVIIIGAAMLRFAGLPEGRDLVIGGSAALFMAMKAKGAENHDIAAPVSARVANNGQPIPPTQAPNISTPNIDKVEITNNPNPSTSNNPKSDASNTTTTTEPLNVHEVSV